MPQYITEVLERAPQGRTQPYVCRADDGEVYFVKGKNATRRGLVCEWVCGQLAKALGLPIAPFSLLEVSDELMAASKAGTIDLSDLGVGTAFGSQRATGVELTARLLTEVPPQLQQGLAVFDWWVRNADRCLTVLGGNVNLLWNESNAPHLVVIDHNLAFDPDFLAEDFHRTHVFADTFSDLCSDTLARDAWREKLVEALKEWDSICGTIPLSWGFLDLELTLPAPIDLADMRKTLARCESETFWNLAP